MAEYTMNDVYGLQFTFKTDGDKKMSVTYSGVQEDLSTATMKAVSDALIANKEAFVQAPTELTAVKYIETLTKEYDLADF